MSASSSRDSASAPLMLAPVQTPDETAAVARLYGEPLLELPADLYIPPDALEVFLQAFEGPLDLLLYLIRKANINVLDIEMAPLTRQYLAYVEAMRRHNLELAADYLLMAATLLEIKSRMLLPKPPRENEQEEEDPRAALMRRLIEYEQMRQAAARLDVLPRVERDFEWVGVFVAEKVVERQPEVNLHDLQQAWLKIMHRSQLTRHHTIQREELSVREYMSRIMRRLQPGAYVVFDTLFDTGQGVSGMVVSFLAILELVKEDLVELAQNEPFAPIYVKLAYAAATS